MDDFIPFYGLQDTFADDSGPYPDDRSPKWKRPYLALLRSPIISPDAVQLINQYM
ncbi:hypothetical protein [Echinicola shivajiensis]|uniref:hypothetical protein n=1 Tax=Echinicola shivajiensis TaxID=1035916 RepID=UPI001BFC3103|nr:hypothetical protein [Echinicola shivajiensis]